MVVQWGIDTSNCKIVIHDIPNVSFSGYQFLRPLLECNQHAEFPSGHQAVTPVDGGVHWRGIGSRRLPAASSGWRRLPYVEAAAAFKIARLVVNQARVPVSVDLVPSATVGQSDHLIAINDHSSARAISSRFHHRIISQLGAVAVVGAVTAAAARGGVVSAALTLSYNPRIGDLSGGVP